MADGDPGISEMAQQETSGRRRSTAYELFILGELMEAPHHGYLLRDILSRMLGPYRQISWAAIYPLIHRLEQENLIAPLGAAVSARPHPTTNDRRRSVRITESGRQRFYALMRAPGEYAADYRELFAIKLLYLDFLTLEQRRAILEHGRAYFERQCAHLRHVFTAESPTTRLPPAAREQVFR